MSYFKAKMHQIRFWLELCPRPNWGSSQCSPRLPSWILRGPTSKGRGRGRLHYDCWGMDAPVYQCSILRGKCVRQLQIVYVGPISDVDRYFSLGVA